MRDRNTKGFWDYLWSNFYWTLVVYVLYRNLLFSTVPGLGYDRSLLVLRTLAVGGMCMNFLLTHRRRRNGLSVFAGIMCCFGIYYILSYWRVDGRRIVRVMGPALAVAGCYGALVLANYIRDRRAKRTKAGFLRCVSGCLMGSRTILAAGLAVLVLGMFAAMVVGVPTFSGGVESVPERGTDLDSATIAGNMDTVLLLQEEQWQKLDLSQRLAVLQTVADIEADYLGIPRVEVCASPLEDRVVGHYTDQNRTVTLSLSHLNTEAASTMLAATCHEVYHSYEHRLVELYESLAPEERKLLLFFDTAQYRYEFYNYIDGTEDYEGYDQQLCEQDSDRYAAAAVTAYYDAIDAHLLEQGIVPTE